MASNIDDQLERGYELESLKPERNYLPLWASQSEKVRSECDCILDIAYGSGSRDRLDFFPADQARSARTVVFIHGGYWQRGDKSIYSFLARPFLKRGVSFIAINYDRCPGTRVSEIVQQVERAFVWLWRNLAELGGNPEALAVAGHSAGAHLAASMIARDWEHVAKAPRDMLKGALLISGIFDLQPLRFTSHGLSLCLEEREAVEVSVVDRRMLVSGPVQIAYGAKESSVFVSQSLRLAGKHRPNILEPFAVPACNHFDVISELGDPDSELFKLALRTVRGRSERAPTSTAPDSRLH